MLFEKEKTYLRRKYLYYAGRTEVPDSVFDKDEEELVELGSELPENIVGSPNYELLEKYGLIEELSIGEREVRFKHIYPMLSLKKYTVGLTDDLQEIYPDALNNFFNSLKRRVICTPKFDGNSMELIYINGKLFQCITRGDEDEGGGLDRTDKLKHIVPNTLDTNEPIVVIRGEIIIQTEKWLEKYSDPNKVDNPRNWIAGKLNKDDADINIIKDCEFIGYQITYIKDNILTRPENQLETIKSFGFPDVFNVVCENYDEFFETVYHTFKDYRIESKYALDGIVLNFESQYWDELGEGNHHPNWACAVKFPANTAETSVRDIVWSLGKDGELTPVAELVPVELDGTMVKRASLHNLGWIIENQVFIGSVVKIAKKGEIIPQVVSIVEKSPYHEEYLAYIDEILKK